MNDDLMRLAQWLRDDWPVEHGERERWAGCVELRVDIDRDADRVFARILFRSDFPADLRNDLELLHAMLAGPRREAP